MISRTITEALVSFLLSKGHRLELAYWDDYSHLTGFTNDASAIMAEVNEDDKLLVVERLGWIYLMPGNGPDVISDNSVSVEPLLDEFQPTLDSILGYYDV